VGGGQNQSPCLVQPCAILAPCSSCKAHVNSRSSHCAALCATLTPCSSHLAALWRLCAAGGTCRPQTRLHGAMRTGPSSSPKDAMTARSRISGGCICKAVYDRLKQWQGQISLVGAVARS